MKTKVKTIDIQAKEWFDKVNGNSYFAGTVTVNFGMKTEKRFSMPFQYGYGDHYIQMAAELLDREKVINREHYNNGSSEALWSYCEKNNIILRSNIQTGCKKSELK